MGIDFTQGEAKEALDKAVAVAVETATKGLKEKNDELLSEKKKLGEQVKELETKFEGIDPVEFKALKDGTEKNLKDAKELRARWDAENKPVIEKLTKERDQALSSHRADRIERDVTDALVAANISKDLIGAAKDHILARRKVEVGEGGATIDGKPAKEFAQAWVAADGKAFVAALDNSGGGAGGGAGSGGAGSGKKLAQMSAAEKAALGADAYAAKVQSEMKAA